MDGGKQAASAASAAETTAKTSAAAAKDHRSRNRRHGSTAFFVMTSRACSGNGARRCLTYPDESKYNQDESDQDSTISKEDDCSVADDAQSSSSKAHRPGWKPMSMKGEHFPEVASSLEDGNIGNDNKMKQKLRRHLVALGWRIELKVDSIRRFRYISPEGNTFYSLPTVCSELSGIRCSSSRRKATHSSEKQAMLVYTKQELTGSEVATVREQIEPECAAQDTITEYMTFIESKFSNVDVNQMRSNVKKMLLSMGWKLWLKDKKGKQELRYTRPEGKTYISLYTACKGYVEEQGSSPEIKPSRKRDTTEPLSNQQSKRKKIAAFPVAVGHDSEISSPTRQSKRKKSSSPNVRRSSKASRHIVTPSPCHNFPKTVLNWMIDNDVVLPREKVFYCHERGSPAVKEGRVTRHGIKCECCKQVLSLADFKAHSGRNSISSGRPATSSIFLQDGRSLLQCQLQLVHSDAQQQAPHTRVKADFSSCYTDGICSVCQDGGSLMICDHCPSAFHPGCSGLEHVPQGDWFCHRCRCTVCGSSEFQHEQFTEKTVLYCDQCEWGYHVGCLGETDSHLTNCPVIEWLCSTKCSVIFHCLQGLVGRRNPTSMKGLSWTFLRSSSRDSVKDEIMVEDHSKLHLVLDVLHECFVTIIEPRTQSDFVADLLFNRESELNRLNFRGFYAMVLEKGDEVISVATIRVFGERIAEMPLIGTRFQHRRQGMCRLLVSELEKLLSSAGVERLLLPAVPQLLSTWIGSFGFAKMTASDRLALSEYSILRFQGTIMCQKAISNACS